jgi:hypothetical protein
MPRSRSLAPSSRVYQYRQRNLVRPFLLNVGSYPAAEANMNGLIYLIGLIVVIMAILSFFGLR